MMHINKPSSTLNQIPVIQLLNEVLEEFQNQNITNLDDIVTWYNKLIQSKTLISELSFDCHNQEDNLNIFHEIVNFFSKYDMIESSDRLFFYVKNYNITILSLEDIVVTFKQPEEKITLDDISKIVWDIVSKEDTDHKKWSFYDDLHKQINLLWIEHTIESHNTSQIVTLSEINKDSQQEKDILNSFLLIHNHLLSLLTHSIDYIKRETSTQQHQEYQYKIEQLLNTTTNTIAWILMQSPWDIQQLTTDQIDFHSGMKTIDNIIPTIKVESPKFLHNLLLWINRETGNILTTSEKNEDFGNYFHMKWVKDIRPQEETSNLLVQQLFTNIDKHIWSVLTLEERALNWMYRKVSSSLWRSPLVEKQLLSILKSRFDKAPIFNNKIRSEIIMKTENQFMNIDKRRRHKINTQSTDRLMADKLLDIYTKLFNYEWKQKISEDLEVKKEINAIKTKYETEGMELLHKFLWEKFTDITITKEWHYTNRKRRCKSLIKSWHSPEDIEKFIIKEIEPLYKKRDNDINKIWDAARDQKAKYIIQQIQEYYPDSILTTNIFEQSLTLYLLRQFQNYKKDIYSAINVYLKELGDVFEFIIQHLDDKWWDKLNIEYIIESVQQQINSYKEARLLEEIAKCYSLTINYDIWKRTTILQKYIAEILNNTYALIIDDINKIEEIKERARQRNIELDDGEFTTLERYYIFKLRTPETNDSKNHRKYSLTELDFKHDQQLKENNIANLVFLEKLIIDSGSQLTRSQILNIDLRNYQSIPKSQRFDINEVVPIRENLPKVNVLCYGNRDKENISKWHYLLIFDHNDKIFKLIYDDSVQDTAILQERWKLYNVQILGWWFMEFNNNKHIIQISDMSEKYRHEPRLLTVWAIRNALMLITWHEWQIFLWKDGYSKISDYDESITDLYSPDSDQNP